MLKNTSCKIGYFSLVILGGIALLGCKKKVNSGNSQPANIVAWVNRVPLTEHDLRQGSRGHGADFMGPPRAALLDQLIYDELLAQEALTLGLDQDPQFKERIQRAEAQYRAIRRKELADIFFRRQIADKAQVTEEDVKRFYTTNEAHLKTSIHVLQLLFRDENLARQALAKIKSGSAFEVVAAQQFSVLPESAQKPWDLGFLGWRQIPAVWRSTIFSMKPGDVSEVISGENQRYWVLKLVDRRAIPNVTFESLKTSLQDELKSQQIINERARVALELRKKGDIKLETPQSSPTPSAPLP
jgi:hypothetical protein